MTLLYVKEHIECFNYEKGEHPIVEKITLSSGEKFGLSSVKNKLFYLQEGSLQFSYAKYKNNTIEQNEMVLIPASTRVETEALEPTIFYIIRLRNVKNLCECFSLDMLLQEEDDYEDETTTNEGLFILRVDKKIETFFKHWAEFISEGLLCRYYLGIKTRELFYLLRAYHTKSDLLAFFYPMLSNDMTFSEFVVRNHHKVRTVNDLAELANYSLSGFQKRFKKVFGVSAYTWMKEEKLKAIYYDINNTPKTFKEISSQFGFSSPSHFNDFCKLNFGHTPGIIRKNKIHAKITKE